MEKAKHFEYSRGFSVARSMSLNSTSVMSLSTSRMIPTAESRGFFVSINVNTTNPSKLNECLRRIQASRFRCEYVWSVIRSDLNDAVS